MRPKPATLNCVSLIVKAGLKIFGQKKGTVVAAHLAEKLVPTIHQKTNYGVIKFLCPGKIPVARARSFHRKEPQTLRWIESFRDSETLWDIGANVGVYTLYAALKGQPVLAFEPSPSNFHVLSRNIELNKLDDRVLAYCLAFSDHTKLDIFHMADTRPGAALNTFGKIGAEPDQLTARDFQQGMLGFSIDDFIDLYKPPFPNHIKIDVDGIEAKILRGARDTLNDRRVKSVLVELDISDKEYIDQIVAMFEGLGLIYFNKDIPDSNKRRAFPVRNLIFARTE